MQIAGDAVDDVAAGRPRIRRAVKAEVNVACGQRIIDSIRGDRDFGLVIAETVTASDDELVIEGSRGPIEPDLRAEVCLLRSPETTTELNVEIGVRVRTRAKLR